MEGPPPFVFPAAMARDVAEALLAEAYHGLDAGKLLRRALRLQREAGWDPPMDVQYVGQPGLVESEAGLGVGLNTEILLYDEFDGVDECVEIFDEVLADALIERLEKKVQKWSKRNR